MISSPVLYFSKGIHSFIIRLQVEDGKENPGILAFFRRLPYHKGII